MVDESASFVLFNFHGEQYSVNLGALQDGKMVLNMKGKNRPVILQDTHYIVDGQEIVIDAPKRMRRATKAVDHGQMKSPMPGKILKILVKVGDEVTLGTPILVMEAMKMEHTISAPAAGLVKEVFFAVGDQVTDGASLISVE